MTAARTTLMHNSSISSTRAPARSLSSRMPQFAQTDICLVQLESGLKMSARWVKDLLCWTFRRSSLTPTRTFTNSKSSTRVKNNSSRSRLTTKRMSKRKRKKWAWLTKKSTKSITKSRKILTKLKSKWSNIWKSKEAATTEAKWPPRKSTRSNVTQSRTTNTLQMMRQSQRLGALVLSSSVCSVTEKAASLKYGRSSSPSWV